MRRKILAVKVEERDFRGGNWRELLREKQTWGRQNWEKKNVEGFLK